MLFTLAAILVMSGAAAAQQDPGDRRLEPGKDEIVRPVFKKPDPAADRAQNLKDTARIAELVAALQQELKNSSPHIKLIRKVRARMR